MNENKFVDGINSKLYIDSNIHKVKFDYAWVDMFEDVIPYIDNILRNPKRFIVNEEEIVKVELAKKITVESVIHLTQHTNLIQDIDENGDVKPSKILNINKEENFDTYENRFVYTLINNMHMFYNYRINEGYGESFLDSKKNYIYEGSSIVGTKNFNISINFTNNEKTYLQSKGKNNKMLIEDRLTKIKQQIDSFTCSELYKILNKAHVPDVRSPIRKTNVILKNPNFQKANQLWNYIQSYNGSGVTRNKEHKKFMNKGNLKKKYDKLFIDTYINTINNIDESKVSKRDMILYDIEKLINNIYNIDEKITETEIKKIFNLKLKSVNKKNNRIKKDINNIILKTLNNDENKIMEAIKILNVN